PERPPRQGALPDQQQRAARAARLADDCGAGRGRAVHAEAVRRRLAAARGGRTARRAVPARHRGAARRVPRARADEHAQGSRRVPLLPAAPRDRTVRARPRVGGLGSRGARLAAAVAAALAGCAPAAAASWTGTYRLPASAAPVAISIGADGTVALGPGHLGPTRVAMTSRG